MTDKMEGWLWVPMVLMIVEAILWGYEMAQGGPYIFYALCWGANMVFAFIIAIIMVLPKKERESEMQFISLDDAGL